MEKFSFYLAIKRIRRIRRRIRRKIKKQRSKALKLRRKQIKKRRRKQIKKRYRYSGRFYSRSSYNKQKKRMRKFNRKLAKNLVIKDKK